jgi:5-methyltetrahydrofolate--homocysteine methyltransferase
VTAFNPLHKAVYNGDVQKVLELTEVLIRQDPDAAARILNEGLIGALEQVGKEFASGELFLPEVMLSAHAIHEGMRVLEPFLAAAGVEPRGSVVIGTVKSDQHDIGKNIVAMMLRGSGFRVKDLGIDVGPERFARALEEFPYQIVALSALLTTSLPWVEKTVRALEEAGLRNRVKIVAGGAVLDARRALGMGADGYAPDAARAVNTCKELLGLS